MGHDQQPPPLAAPPAHRTNCEYLRCCRHRRRSTSTNLLQTLSPAARPYTPVVHSTTTAEGPLPVIQRHCEPRRGRSRLYTAPETYHRDRRTSTSPAISPPKPRCSTRGDGAGPADAVQRCHSPLQQSLGFAGRHGQEEGRQPTVLCRLQAAQRGNCEGRASHSSHRRLPRRTPRSPLVLHS